MNPNKPDERRVPRRVIHLDDRRYHELCDEIVEVLVIHNNPPTLFLRENALVSFNNGKLIEVSDHAFVYRLSEIADWQKNGKCSFPHFAIVQGVLNQIVSNRSLPELLDVVDRPVMLPDGSFVDTPGYHPSAKLAYSPSPLLTLPPIPENPTEHEIRQAVALIEEIAADFPISNNASLANFVAAVLTVVLRAAIVGNIPILIIDANMPGTGKTMIARILGIIGGADRFMTMPDSHAEFRKQITTNLMGAPLVFILDEVAGSLDNKDLRSVLTNDTWSDRILGVSKQVTIPIRCLWVATGNNMEIEEQLIRRSFWVRLVTDNPNPSERPQEGFKHPELLTYVRENRGRIIAAALILGRAWFAAKCPKGNVLPLGSFERWTEVISGILSHAGVGGFMGNRRELREHADPEAANWARFSSLLHFHFRQSFMQRDVIKLMGDMPDLKDAAQQIWGEAVNSDALLQQRMSRTFREKAQVPVNVEGTKLILEPDGKYQGTARWRIRVEPPKFTTT